MCLRVFTDDEALYLRLEKGAATLVLRIRKVNFLRDIKADHEMLGRWYFPYGSFESFDDKIKARIIKDIEKDFVIARKGAAGLPKALGVQCC